MKAKDMMGYLADMFPSRRSSADWIVPASIGLGLGLAAGVGVGLLLAPQPGDVTRRKLREGAERVRERALAASKASSGMSEHQSAMSGERPLSSDYAGGR